MLRRVLHLSAIVGLLALGLLLVPFGRTAASEPASFSGLLGAIMLVLQPINDSLLLRLLIFVSLSAAACLALFWHRLGDRAQLILVLIDGFVVLLLALQVLTGSLSA